MYPSMFMAVELMSVKRTLYKTLSYQLKIKRFRSEHYDFD